jgi:hypothetical protein
MTPPEIWVDKIKLFIEQGQDPYVTALHIYNEVFKKAIQEKQDEFDYINCLKNNNLPN